MRMPLTGPDNCNSTVLSGCTTVLLITCTTEGMAGFAIGENERAVGGGVILGGEGRAIDGGEVDGRHRVGIVGSKTVIVTDTFVLSTV